MSSVVSPTSKSSGRDAKRFLGLDPSSAGYYIDVGCSIDVVALHDCARFEAGGLRLRDGGAVEADLVVLATGFESQREGIRRLLGEAVADRVGDVWGFDEDGFERNMWQRTGQRGLWIMGGGLNECRLWSRFLALQVKAGREGLVAAESL